MLDKATLLKTNKSEKVKILLLMPVFLKQGMTLITKWPFPLCWTGSHVKTNNGEKSSAEIIAVRKS